MTTPRGRHDQLAGLTLGLRRVGDTGEIVGDPASRMVIATDNSVYEVSPLAIFFPYETAELPRIACALLRPARWPLP